MTMLKEWPKVILDPVHNLIPLENNPCDLLMLNLINCAEFQRLRRIKQLGLCEMVFPGANHSRFAHSIGVMHVARKMIGRLEDVLGKKFADDIKMTVCAAALLHDVGHGPFSHAFEKVTKENHEARSLEIIKNDTTHISKELTAIDSKLPEMVGLFIEPTSEEDWRKAGLPLFLHYIVSSQLDADRFDYLLRDSFSTGTTYGNFDLSWILLHLKTDSEERRVVLGRKAVSAVESYVFARHYMYKSVYFHKTTRAAEVMLRLAFARYVELLKASDTTEAKRKIVPEAPQIILDGFTGNLSLEKYLWLDDYIVTEFLKNCEYSPDKTLRELGCGIVHRNLFKAFDLTGVSGEKVSAFVEQAKKAAAERGYASEYSVVADRAADTSYKPYNPATLHEPNQIFIENQKGEPCELSLSSDPVQELTKEAVWLRYYIPEPLREDIGKIYDNTIKKG